MNRSPFLIYQNFLSQEECTKIISETKIPYSKDDDGNDIASFRSHKESEKLIFDKFQQHIPEIVETYGFKYKATESINFHQYPSSSSGKLIEDPHCDNAVFKRKKWIRISARDLSCVLWLKDYQDQPPFDLEKHVYGGKLEFPLYNFSFQPQLGTLVVFPSCERFIQATTSVLVGDLHLAKFYVHSSDVWIYDPNKFPGDFRTWFSDIV